jgi:hypothetical protein
MRMQAEIGKDIQRHIGRRDMGNWEKREAGRETTEEKRYDGSKRRKLKRGVYVLSGCGSTLLLLCGRCFARRFRRGCSGCRRSGRRRGSRIGRRGGRREGAKEKLERERQLEEERQHRPHPARQFHRHECPVCVCVCVCVCVGRHLLVHHTRQARRGRE